MNGDRPWWQCPTPRGCYPELVVDVREGVVPEVVVRHWCVGEVSALPAKVWLATPPRPTVRVSA